MSMRNHLTKRLRSYETYRYVEYQMEKARFSETSTLNYRNAQLIIPEYSRSHIHRPKFKIPSHLLKETVRYFGT
jgi:hypothetical protein